MSKKTIVLADSSYTIRRIVELSFSEEEGIELVSFENSVNLRERLMELAPAIVLVDIKFPEFNGYEVCQFINSSEKLKHTHVFLLKGGFEPVDENLLKGLRFVDIITKPFDSNALVSTIKKLLQETPGAVPPPPSPSVMETVPSSIPEDIPEIDSMPEADEGINFSDIKQEIDSSPIMPTGAGEDAPAYPDEEVLPSEEITRAQPERDTLAPSTENGEDIDNPFKDEMPGQEGADSLTAEELAIKKNIEEQERELEIGSLTQEEMYIKQQLGKRGNEFFKEPFAKEKKPGVESEPKSDLVSEFFERPASAPPKEKPFPVDKSKEEEVTEIPDLDSIKLDQAAEPEVKEIPDLKTDEIEKEMELEPGIPETPTTRKIEKPSLDFWPKGGETPDEGPSYQPPSPFEEKEESPPLEIPPAAKVEDKAPEEPVVEIPPMETPPPIEDIELEEPPVMDYEVPPPPTEIEKPSKKIEPEIPPVEEKIEFAEQLGPVKKEMPSVQKEEVLNRIEDKLSAAIKEMLWEIVPPLAEKIITKEIEEIKAEVSKSSK
jgi:DNA-binding response OmpR family regulator